LLSFGCLFVKNTLNVEDDSLYEPPTISEITEIYSEKKASVSTINRVCVLPRT
jgi:hypothetical protein